MNNKKEFQLLKDLAELLKKYGPESFASLAELISDKKTIQDLSTILMELSKSSKSIVGAKKKPLKNKVFRESIIEAFEENSERATLFLDIYDKLEDKRYLPTPREIRLFCEDNALKPISAKSRKAAVKQFVKTLMELPFDEASMIKKSLDDKGTPEDRSLDGWSSIILNGGEKDAPAPTIEMAK